MFKINAFVNHVSAADRRTCMLGLDAETDSTETLRPHTHGLVPGRPITFLDAPRFFPCPPVSFRTAEVTSGCRINPQYCGAQAATGVPQSNCSYLKQRCLLPWSACWALWRRQAHFCLPHLPTSTLVRRICGQHYNPLIKLTTHFIEFTPTWIANSFCGPYAQRTFAQYFMHTLWVQPDGLCIGGTPWDEGANEIAFFKDGESLGPTYIDGPWTHGGLGVGCPPGIGAVLPR